MGFIKVGSIVRIKKIGRSIGDLGLGDEQLKHLGSRIATADFVNLNPGRFIYTRERAVSAFERYGLNGNADGFLDEELRQRYASFINSPRYIDHDNADTTRAIGIVLDAVYHPLTHPQGGWVETVSALDKEKMAQIVLHSFPNQPTMLDAVIGGQLSDTSMGCFVEQSVCTVCGNRAATEHEYCDHVVAQRGRRVKAASTCPVPVDRDGFVVAGELNFGVTFFELSNITSLAQYGGGGADPDAKILEKIACSGWECFIVDRYPRQLAVRPTRASGSHCGCTVASANTRPVDQEGNMGNLTKKGVDVAPVAPADAQSVTDRITSATDPVDEDKKLFDQSKGKSDGGNEPSVATPDNISQEKKPQDYPLTARKNKSAVGVEADPANTLGGTPEPVAQEEEKMRKEKFKGVKPELGDRGTDVEHKMEDELDEEKPMSEALGALFSKRFPAIAASERFKEIQDNLDILETRRASVVAALNRTRSEKRKEAHKQALREINASILKYFGQFGGNPQDMDETFKDGYDVGADKKLYNQAKPESEGVKPQTVAVPDGITQEKDPKDYPLKGAKKIASTEADKAAKEMLDLVWHQGKSFEEAQQIIFDRYGSEVAQASKKQAACPDVPEPKEETEEEKKKKKSGKDGGEPPAESLDEMKDKAKKDKDKEAKTRTAEGEKPVEVDEADGKSDIGQAVGDDKEEIDKGNTTTLVSPDTKKVAPSSELIQARLSRPRAALYQQVLGAGSAETELKKGNEDTLASPETKDKADAESKEQEKRTKNLSQGVNVPAEITGSFGLAMAVINEAKKEVMALRQQNVRLAKRLTAVKANWKWEECKKIAFAMLKKGFFLEDPKNGSQRNWLQQKEAMIAEAKSMMRRPNEEVEGVKSLVARAPMPGRPVKEWTRKISMPREGTVKSAIAARSAANPDEAALEHMFD